ncbi:helix-turn-helix domain-containing protein [Desmospora profundinema]|uniref:Tetratricopeptide (TPR) repeat protein n=1 Tax=Desmospora profundinema TaxID=1571184 RepID=A0ABU1IQ19_9BACL|nr:helix-turn-helix domain-containing protein [Desmospora profundinema]MDR6226873.1 tetratricopeptide (TPR) repeat protein [Desmospora profundinema]
MGKIIRQTRKERGLRLEDLADQNISPATISNIERGVSHVSKRKILYIMERLDLDESVIPKMLLQEKEQTDEILLKLMSIESLIDAKQLKKASFYLDKVKLNENHPLLAFHHYLKAKCLLAEEKYNRAEKLFFKAIQFEDLCPEQNIKSCSYNNLGYIFFYRNDLNRALYFTEKGIESFIDNKSGKSLWFMLYRNKAIYLERLGNLHASYQTILQVWDEKGDIEDSDTLLTLYWIRSEVSRKMGMYEEAIEFATRGIRIAAKNKVYYSLLTLWIVLGSVYMNLKEWESAETCLITARSLEENLPSHLVSQTNVYSRLSVLYMRIGKETQAFETIKKSIDASEKINNAPYLINDLLILANFHKKNGNLTNSIQQYKKALELCRKYNYEKKEKQVIYQMALCTMLSEENRITYLKELYALQKEFQIGYHQDPKDIF